MSDADYFSRNVSQKLTKSWVYAGIRAKISKIPNLSGPYTSSLSPLKAQIDGTLPKFTLIGSTVRRVGQIGEKSNME